MVREQMGSTTRNKEKLLEEYEHYLAQTIPGYVPPHCEHCGRVGVKSGHKGCEPDVCFDPPMPGKGE
jgi:hypothetical protein